MEKTAIAKIVSGQFGGLIFYEYSRFLVIVMNYMAIFLSSFAPQIHSSVIFGLCSFLASLTKITGRCAHNGVATVSTSGAVHRALNGIPATKHYSFSSNRIRRACIPTYERLRVR